jgi:hypothetical protein
VNDSQKRVEMANKYLKSCPASSAIKEMPTKMALRFHLTPVRVTIVKKTPIWQGCGKDEPHAAGGCVLVHRHGKQYGGSSKH